MFAQQSNLFLLFQITMSDNRNNEHKKGKGNKDKDKDKDKKVWMHWIFIRFLIDLITILGHVVESNGMG